MLGLQCMCLDAVISKGSIEMDSVFSLEYSKVGESFVHLGTFGRQARKSAWGHIGEETLIGCVGFLR